MSDARVRRLADRIREIVAELLERRVKDPRLGFVTITDTRLTGDLRDATVYYTVYGTADEQAATAEALESAKGLLRSEVGRQIGLRHTPSLTFIPDQLPDGARHIDELLAKAKVADAELERVRAGAMPAGDPQPYREPSGDLDDERAGDGGEAGADTAR